LINEEMSMSPGPGIDATLVGAETGLRFESRLLAGGASYSRPTRVVAGGVAVPIVDYLMIARLVAVALVLLATAWRLSRG
jgi:hypothetical protein